MFIVLGLLLSGCANPRVQAYRKDPQAFLKVLVHCENNYAALKDTPECRAAIKLNEEMFPGWYP
jgi:ferritin-like protein